MTTSTGSAWLAFLATLGGRYRSESVERLPDASALDAFLSGRGLRPLRRPTPADVPLARELREAMHAVTRAACAGEPPAAAARRRLATALAQDEPLALLRSGPVRVRPPADAGVALARLARAMVADLTGPRLSALRACGDTSCSGFFFDDTGRRHWCAAGTCGTRVRVQRHRARATSP